MGGTKDVDKAMTLETGFRSETKKDVDKALFRDVVLSGCIQLNRTDDIMDISWTFLDGF